MLIRITFIDFLEEILELRLDPLFEETLLKDDNEIVGLQPLLAKMLEVGLEHPLSGTLIILLEPLIERTIIMLLKPTVEYCVFVSLNQGRIRALIPCLGLICLTLEDILKLIPNTIDIEEKLFRRELKKELIASVTELPSLNIILELFDHLPNKCCFSNFSF